MKIAMIIDAWEPIVGGGQIHVKNICDKLIKNHNCKIDLFVRSLKGDDEKIYNQDEILLDGKLRIIRCGRPKHFFDFSERILSIFSIFFRVLKENKKQKYDLIHAHTFLGLISGKLSSIFLNIPIISTIHGANLLDKGEKSFYYFIEKFLLTKIRYDKIISVGSSFLKYKNINKNIVVIGNGVNIEEFENLKIEKKENIYKILFVGRLEWTKGIDILVESINKIDKNTLEEKKVEFHLVGYGYQEAEYKKLVQKYNLEKYIIFRGKITGKNLIKEYKTSDLFILPSRTEGFGITIIEAMASKIPVIATICGGPEDIIQNCKNGFLIEKENIEDLKNIIIDFVTGKISNLDIIKESAYNTVKNNYTWDIIGDKIYNEYKKNMKKLNLGCGNKPLNDYVNLDLLKLNGVDIVHNMEEYPYPFNDNTFDEILAEHNFEHISDLESLMREIYRISKNGSLIKIEVPYYTCNSSFADPTHKRFFTSRTMNYFSNHFYFNDINFNVKKVRIHFFTNKDFLNDNGINKIINPIINLSPNVYERFFAWIFPSSEIHYLLEVKKIIDLK